VTEHLFDGLRADFEERFQALPEQDRTPRQGVDRVERVTSTCC
jgi:hypothetical protein